MNLAIYRNKTGTPLTATLGNNAEIRIAPGKEGKLDPKHITTRRWLAHGFIEFLRVPEKKVVASKTSTKKTTEKTSEGKA